MDYSTPIELFSKVILLMSLNDYDMKLKRKYESTILLTHDSIFIEIYVS